MGFPGPAGRESAGIVDLMAIRKDHSKSNGKFKRGDLFEIILIQIKGGGARWPNADDIRRLRAVAKRYSAKDVILAEWTKGSHQNFYRLETVSGFASKNRLEGSRSWRHLLLKSENSARQLFVSLLIACLQKFTIICTPP